MRLCKIQYSRVTAALLIFLSGVALMAPSRVAAQCGGVILSTSYDTTYGGTTSNPTGNPIGGAYTYPLPRFPVSSSTLLAVVVTSTITVSASMTVQNQSPTNPLPAPFAQIFRSDGFNSNYINKGSTVVSNPVFGGPLNPGQSETLAFPDIISSQEVLYDSVTASNGNFPNFTGVGHIGFTYASNNIPLPSSGLSVTSYTLTEQINYTTTYYYCVPGTLATDILTFTATRENNQTALLNWTTSNELPGRNYVIQVSKDGTNFADSTTVPAQVASGDAAYTNNFPLDPSATGNLYFRLKVVDVSGPFHYSQICILRLGDGNASGFSIYPNPPKDFINLSFPGGNQNWDVAIYAADGNMVQRNSYPTTNLVRVNFNRKMAAGTYFVRAINPQTNQSYARSFVINTP
jgi:hypothetical protein